MGTRVAPSFANIYMADFEETHVYTYPKQPELWTRFIDDIHFLWHFGTEELHNFVDYLNSRNDTIRFTLESSELRSHFLDITVIRGPDGTLCTDLYTKPTDTHNYLPYNSAHAHSHKQGTPYSQFFRIRRICSKISDFDKHSLHIAQIFLDKGYPQHLVENSLIRARRQD